MGAKGIAAGYRVARWLVGVLVVLALLAAAVSQTAIFRDWLRARLVARVNAALAATVTLGGLEGNLVTGLGLRDLRIELDGARVLAARRVGVRYDLLALLRGQVRLTLVTLDGLALTLHEDARGWNLARLAGDEPEAADEDRAGLALVLEQVRVRDAALKIVRPTAVWKARDLALRGAARVAADARVTLDAAAFVLAGRGIVIEDLAGGLEIAADGSVRAERVRLKSAESEVRAHAHLAADRATGVDLAADGRVSARELARVLGRRGLGVDVAGRLEAHGPASAVAVAATLASDAGALEIGGRLDLSRDPPAYDLRAKLAHVDARAVFGPALPPSDLSGTLTLTGTGTTLETAATNVALELVDSMLAGTALARLAVEGRIEDRTIGYTASARSTVGRVEAKGTLALATERYELALTAEEFDPTPWLGRPELGARVNGTLTLRGTGLALATTRGEARLTLGSGRLHTVAIREGAVDLRATGDRLVLDRLALVTDAASAEASGTLVTAPGAAATGTAQYRIRVEDLAPLARLAGATTLGGALEIAGDVRGRLGALALTATVTGRDLARADTRVGRLRASVRADALGAPGARAEVRAHAEALRALGRPLAGLDIEGVWERAEAAAARATLALDVREDATHRHRFAAALTLAAAYRRAEIAELRLDLGDETWTVEGRPVVEARDGGVTVDALALRSGRGRLRLDGGVGGDRAQALALAVEGLDLKMLAPMLGASTSGRLFATARLSGTAKAPRLDAEVRIAEATLGGARYQSARADVAADGARATLDLTLVQEPRRTLALTAALPLRFALAPWRFEAGPALSGRLRAQSIDLALVDPFVAELSKVSGRLDADLALAGTLDRPELVGTLAVAEARARVVPLGLTYDPVELHVRLDRRALTITSLRIGARDGTLTGGGTVRLGDAAGPALAIRVELAAFPLFRNQFGHARARGTIRVSGQPAAPVIEGTLESDGLVLQIPETLAGAVRPPDPTITVVATDAADAAARASAEPSGAAAAEGEGGGARRGAAAPPATAAPTTAIGDAYERAAVAVELKIPRNAWIRRSDANIELRGWMAARKNAGAPLELTGEIHAVRGWYTFQGKKFTVREGQVTFTGQDFDPLLRLVAVHVAGEYTVRAVVGGTIAEPTLVLESDPVLDQADILSVLLFGKPAHDLSQGESQGLREQALGVAGGYVASELRQQVADALGLDNLEFDAGAQGLADAKVSFGKYVADDIFVSLTHGFGKQSVQEVRVEYSLTPQWSIETSSDTQGDSGIDVFWKRRY